MSDLKEKAKSVRWTGLKRLEATRGVTQAELERDIVSSAREGKKDISVAVGGRQPTEVYRDGRWIKVMDLD